MIKFQFVLAISIAFSLMNSIPSFAQNDGIPLEIPFTPQSPTLPAGSLSEVSYACSAALSGLTPSQIQWSVDLSQSLEISYQGGLGSCWANTEADLMTLALRKVNELKATERLSIDYYTSVMMRSRAMSAFRNGSSITLATMNGGTALQAYRIFSSQGIVLDQEFAFPKFPVRLKDGPVEMRDLRTSRILRRQFEVALAQPNLSQTEVERVLNQYLGNPAKLRITRRLFQDMQKKLTPEFFTALENRNSPNLVPKFEIDSQLYPIQEASYEGIDRKIIHALDAKLAVQIDVRDYSEIGNLLWYGGTSFFGKLIPTAHQTGSHMWTIKGYHLNQGKVDWYLISNSGGESWGEQGSASISAELIHRHTRLFSIPSVDSLVF